jgi:hypothetical protein
LISLARLYLFFMINVQKSLSQSHIECVMHGRGVDSAAHDSRMQQGPHNFPRQPDS